MDKKIELMLYAWIQECSQEISALVNWWESHGIDNVSGGFYGEVNQECNPNEKADKSLVLNARILWTFSAIATDDSFQHTSAAKKSALLAHRAYKYLATYFHDKQHGGAFWSVNYLGEPSELSKQSYGIAFALYALVAYYKLRKSSNIKLRAIEYFNLIEYFYKCPSNKGYSEFFSREWNEIDEHYLYVYRELDKNKSLNNHIHIMEAYTSLYSIYRSKKVHDALENLILYILENFIDKNSLHLRMFIDDQGNDQSNFLSFGHEIEFSWLVTQSIDALQNNHLQSYALPIVKKIISNSQALALGTEGQLLESFSIKNKSFVQHTEWWAQAEAMIGYINAFEITENVDFLVLADDIWCYIKNYHIDYIFGEWNQFPQQIHKNNKKGLKISEWKGPYHNGRCMLEVISRAKRILKRLKANNATGPKN